MYFKRIQEEIVNKHIGSKKKHKDVLLVSGARQTGKSTLIKEMLKKKEKVILLDLAEQISLIEDINQTKEFSEFQELLVLRFNFKDQGEIIFIDEAQLCERLEYYVRFMKEKWLDTTVILSGSMLSNLFQNRYPVGRVQETTIRPLSFIEYLNAIGANEAASKILNYKIGENVSETAHRVLVEALNDYFLTGGLPEVVLAKALNQNWLEVREKVLSGFRKDLATFFGQEQARLAWQVFRSISYYVGSVSKNTNIVPSHHEQYRSVSKILSLLESWHLILYSEQKGDQPENILFPKRYLFDMGILQQIRYTARPLPILNEQVSPEEKQAQGGLLENYIAQTIASVGLNLEGFRNQNFEIDFVLRGKKGVSPIEVKASNRNKTTYIRGLKKYLENYRCYTGICFTLDRPKTLKLTEQKAKTINYVPIYMAEKVVSEFSTNKV